MSEQGFFRQNAGSIITIAVLVFGIAVSWGRMDARDNRQDERIVEAHEKANKNAAEIAASRTEFTTKLADKDRELRAEIERRNDETRTSLATMNKELAEMKSSLRSIETNLSWIVKSQKLAPSAAPP